MPPRLVSSEVGLWKGIGRWGHRTHQGNTQGSEPLADSGHGVGWRWRLLLTWKCMCLPSVLPFSLLPSCHEVSKCLLPHISAVLCLPVLLVRDDKRKKRRSAIILSPRGNGFLSVFANLSHQWTLCRDPTMHRLTWSGACDMERCPSSAGLWSSGAGSSPLPSQLQKQPSHSVTQCLSRSSLPVLKQ